MDFTITPEEIIFVFSSSLNSKLRSKSWINLLSVSNSVQEISFSKWLISIDIQIIVDFTRSITLSFTIFEKSKFANHIHIMKIVILMNTSFAVFVIFPGHLWENSSLVLGSNIKHSSENGTLNWYFHPDFSE